MKKIKIVIFSLLALSLISCAGAAGGGGGGGSADSNSITSVPITFDVGGNNFFLVIQNPETSIHDELIISSQNCRAVESFKREMSLKGKSVDIPFEHNNIKVDINKYIQSSNSRNSFYSLPSSIVNSSTDNWESNLQIGDTHNFFAEDAIKGTTNNTSAAGSVLKEIGEHCYVWYKENNGISVDEDRFTTVKEKFDDIFERERYIFGSNIPNYSAEISPYLYIINQIFINITDNHKIHILIYDLKDDFNTNTGATEYGYFWSLDFLRNDYLQASSYEEDHLLQSNECQCIHIDSPTLGGSEPEKIYSTLAHEFQHLLNFVNKSLSTISIESGYDIQSSSTWFNEMMSMVCEDIMLTQLGLNVNAGPQSRLSLFNSSYYNGFQWLSGNNVLISYANAYAFGAFILRNYGIECVFDIAHNSYVDEQAILYAVSSRDNSIHNFSDLLKKFYNTILYPENTVNTLNRSVSKTYTINGEEVHFTCAAINLNSYKTYTSAYMTANNAAPIYQGVVGEDFYGPEILQNGYLYNYLGPKGTCIVYCENDFDSIIINTNPHLKYYIEQIN